MLYSYYILPPVPTSTTPSLLILLSLISFFCSHYNTFISFAPTLTTFFLLPILLIYSSWCSYAYSWFFAFFAHIFCSSFSGSRLSQCYFVSSFQVPIYAPTPTTFFFLLLLLLLSSSCSSSYYFLPSALTHTASFLLPPAPITTTSFFLLLLLLLSSSWSSSYYFLPSAPITATSLILGLLLNFCDFSVGKKHYTRWGDRRRESDRGRGSDRRRWSDTRRRGNIGRRSDRRQGSDRIRERDISRFSTTYK